MDPGVYALLSALGFNGVIFAVLTLLFLIYRQYRSKHIFSTNPNIIPKNAIYSESDTTLKTLLRHVWSTSLYDIYDKCGLEAYMYMAIHIQIIIWLSVICFFGCIVLVPIYSQGTGINGTDLEKTGIANILEDENYMTASIIFYVLFSALGYGLVFIVLKTVSIKAHPNNIRFFNYVLEISNLPKDTEIDNMYDKVYFVLEKDFGESLLGVYVVPNLANSYVADLNLNYAQEKLEHFKEYLTSHGSREQVRTGILTKVDAIYYYETLVEKYKEEYKENLKDKKKGNSGFAYVTFRTADKAEKAKRYILSRKEKWIVKKAPAPEDIKWENMGEDFEIVKKQRILLTIFFIVLFFILATPAGFLYLVDEALASFNGEEFVHGLFGNYFPTIILLFYQAVIMNYSVKYIVSKEQRTNNSVETTSRLIKYMLFMGFYVFLLQALGTQTLVSMTLEGFWASWKIQLPRAITQTGQFFTVFVVNQAFLSNGFDLLQPIIIIVTKFKLSVAETEKEKLLAQEALPFDMSYELALSLNSFLIILSYSIVFPIILIFGLVHFTLKFCVHKYLILCVNYTNRKSTGISMPMVCLTSITTSVFVFQFLTGLIFTINSSEFIQSIGSILIFISLIIYIFLVLYVRKTLKRAASIAVSSEESMLNCLYNYDENLYIHPIDKKMKK